MRFVYLTPTEFTSETGKARVHGPGISGAAEVGGMHKTPVLFNENYVISGAGDERSVEFQASSAWARIDIPAGSRVHWVECALNGHQPYDMWTPANLSAEAVLRHVRYGDHPQTVPPRELAQVKISGTASGFGDQSIGGGVEIKSPDAVVAEDGWLHLEVRLKIGGLRACRVGYVPPKA